MSTLSIANLPPSHRDASLANRPGELWKDIPGLDGCYQVSNQGRIKRLARDIYDSQGGHYILASRIIIPRINFSPNKITQDETHRLQVCLQVSKKKKSYMVHRLVYYCFVKPFALADIMLNVVPKNGDGLDVRPDNLLLLPFQKRCKRTYEQGRLLCPKELDQENFVKGVRASALTNSKEVSQYDEKGKWLATYISTMDAFRATGISSSQVSFAAKQPAATAGGYFWCYGHPKRINLKEIKELIQKSKKSYRHLAGKKVTQFDLEGHPIDYYEALSEAAKVNHIAHKSITNNIKGRSKHAGGYLWKLGNHM